ncbi:unnamed protein product [Callosobruchus maculatus]|uniref:RNA helicase n=1 Tax=Callosobruchus maculatus TaxID=64391 RepID=A0A653CFP1_CALMS|nr:unnamed protein product [Callosobruchus maculatus]
MAQSKAATFPTKGKYEITTFVNPHLFWMIEVESEARFKTLQELNKLMEELCRNYSKDAGTTFDVGDIVVAKYEGSLYRAILEYIGTDGACSKGQYLCWLIDYGTLVESNTIYKSSASIRKILPLSYQASVNNVVYTLQHLGFGKTGEVEKTTEFLLTPIPQCLQTSMDILSTVNSVEFYLEEKDEGIYFGDIMYKDKNGDQKSFRQYLIDKGIVGINKEWFPEMKCFINEYKDKNLQLIEHICKRSLNSINRKKVCQEIKKKVVEEFEEIEVSEEEMLYPRRSKGKCPSNSKNLSDCNHLVIEDTSPEHKGSLNSSLSQNDMSSECGSPSSSSIMKPSKMAILKKKLEEKRACKKEETTTESSSQVTKDSSGPKRQGKSRIDLREVSKGKIIFGPAGGESSSFLCQKKVEKPKITNTHRPTGNRRPRTQTTTCTIQGITPKELLQRFRRARREESPDSDDESSQLEQSPPQENGESEESSVTESGSTVSSRCVSQMKVKPYCSCKNCDFWTNDKSWEQAGEYEKYKPKVKLTEEPRHVFLKETSDLEPVEILSVNYSSLSRLEKKSTPKLLVHSECLPWPVKELANVHMHPEIYQTVVQEEYKVARRIQTYAWPALFRNQHVFMVHGSQSGKTMAYLTTMCSLLLEKEERYEFAKKLTGAPIVVILCSNTERCRDVHDRARLILGRTKVRIGLVEYPISHVSTHNIDMLVTTPTIFMDLLKKRAVILNGLCHLVFEDGDNILSYFYPLVDKILEAIHKMLKSRYHSRSVQIVLCAEHWNKQMTMLLQRLSDTPVVCIANYLEAAMYGNITFSTRFMRSSTKAEVIKTILKDSYKFTKSVVLCKQNEIEELETILMLNGIEAAVISEDLTVDESHLLEENWTKAPGGNYTVLVTTDHLLNTELNVTSASTLIHFSLPSSWTKFTKRFVCLLENYRSPLDQKESKIVCQNIVLLDENCQEQLPRYFKYMNSTDMKYRLSDELKAYSEELRDNAESYKIDKRIELCEMLKIFGKCRNTYSCPMRHKIDKSLDVNASLPTHGKIKFKIRNVYDVTNYSIEIIETVDSSGNSVPFTEIPDVTEDLTNAMRISRKRPKEFTLGHLYVYYAADDLTETFHRCVLMARENETVRIKLIDEGKELSTVLKNRLYKLPKDFGEDKFPRKYPDVYLANLIPPYEDDGFSNKALYILTNTLEKHDYKNIVLTGYVHLQLSNTLWLRNVEEEVVLCDKVVAGFQLTRQILYKELAVVDLNQLDHLHKMCTQAGLVLPKYEVVSVKEVKEEKITPQWAFLDMEEVQEVIFSSAISPDEMYVRLNKFNDLLYTLNKDIQQAIKKPHYPKLKEVKPGTICLAKDPASEDYNRCIVLKNDEQQALCFFVDFGDEAVLPISDLKYLSNEFITKLPFQGIQCKLFGVKPVFEEWSAEVTDLLYEYHTEPHTDIFRSLYVKVCSKEKTTISDYYLNKYSILLKDGFGKKNSLINDLSIDCGLALPTGEGLEDFEIPGSLPETEESDEYVDLAKDILEKTEEARENFKPGEDFQQADFNEDLELFVDDENLMQFIDQVVNFYRKDNASVFRQELPPIQAAPTVDYLTPELFWYQSDTAVKLTIKVTDVKDYKLTLSKGRILWFRAEKGKDQYCLKLMLYDHIETMQHTATGLDVRITLIKKNYIEWPRLILAKHKPRNIHYDVSMLQVKEETKRVLQLPKELDDEEEESDNDLDMCYEVYSDMDSDFDQEVPHDSD